MATKLLRELIVEEIERQMRVVHESKKEFTILSDGKWYWFDRGNDELLNGPFDKFVDALLDATSS